jgi:hypothetical protein
MGKAVGIVYGTIATHLSHKAGHAKTPSQAGAVTLIQCFGDALNDQPRHHYVGCADIEYVAPL